MNVSSPVSRSAAPESPSRTSAGSMRATSTSPTRATAALIPRRHGRRTTAVSDDMTMLWDEIDDIGDLLHDLDDLEFDTPSLCDGWAVRDVLGHMGTGHTTPFGP